MRRRQFVSLPSVPSPTAAITRPPEVRPCRPGCGHQELVGRRNAYVDLRERHAGLEAARPREGVAEDARAAADLVERPTPGVQVSAVQPGGGGEVQRVDLSPMGAS